MGDLTFLCLFFNIFSYELTVICVLSMWGKIMIPMYRFDYTASMDYMDPDVHCPQKGR